MIVPMKRVTLLSFRPDQEQTLHELRDLGLLHVTPVVAADSEDLENIQESLAAAREALETLTAMKAEGETSKDAMPRMAVDEVIAAVREGIRNRKELAARIEGLEKEEEAARPFGSVEITALRTLASAGVKVKLCQMASSLPVPRIEGAVVQVIAEDKNNRTLAVVSRGEVECPGRECSWPLRPLAAVQGELAGGRGELERAGSRLVALTGHLDAVRKRVGELEAREQFVLVRDGMGAWDRISYLQGYCAEEAIPALREAAARHGWGLLIRDPGADEEAPTLLRNPPWVRPVKAIFDLIGILPGYRELDVSAVFLLFYSVFFAMLVSDAGYGMLFMALTLAIRQWAKRLPTEVPRLLGVLSGCTIVWGVLTGSYFGISLEAFPAVMQGVAIPWMRDEANLMQLCFLIGAVHLSLAHGWALVRVGLCPAALAQLGWIAVTWVMYYLAMNMILGRLMPGFVLPLFLGGVAAVALFMTPLKALKTEWPNHLMLPLTVVGNFGDVVSYVRLFAVGSAGTAISVAFNEMAVGGGIHGVGDGLVAALILFLAHGLNILLAGLAVIVHGVRLNTLEFSGHLGMQWTGVPFKPFQGRDVMK